MLSTWRGAAREVYFGCVVRHLAVGDVHSQGHRCHVRARQLPVYIHNGGDAVHKHKFLIGIQKNTGSIKVMDRSDGPKNLFHYRPAFNNTLIRYRRRSQL